MPTSAKVGIAGFFNNHKARLQKCLRAFFSVAQYSKLFTPCASNASALAWGVKKLVLQWECVCATFVPLELELNQGVDCSGDLGQSLLWTT